MFEAFLKNIKILGRVYGGFKIESNFNTHKILNAFIRFES